MHLDESTAKIPAPAATEIESPAPRMYCGPLGTLPKMKVGCETSVAPATMAIQSITSTTEHFFLKEIFELNDLSDNAIICSEHGQMHLRIMKLAANVKTGDVKQKII